MGLLDKLINKDDLESRLLQIEAKAAQDVDSIIRDVLRDYRVVTVTTFEKKEDTK